MNQNDHMQWRRLVFVAVVLALAGCTNNGESGAPNTAPIREATTTVVVATEAPVTSAGPVTAAVVPSSVAAVDSVPKPVGEDYRVPVVVKFVPSTDAEREVLAAATELLVKQHRNELLFVREQEQLGTVLYGAALEEYQALLETIKDSVVVPSSSDRIVLESLEQSAGVFEAVTCEVDGSKTYDRDPAGRFVLFNDEVATVNKRYVFVETANGWRISTNSTVTTTMGEDKCER